MKPSFLLQSSGASSAPPIPNQAEPWRTPLRCPQCAMGHDKGFDPVPPPFHRRSVPGSVTQVTGLRSHASATRPRMAFGGFCPSVSSKSTGESPGGGGRDNGTGPHPVSGSQGRAWPRGRCSISCWSVPPGREYLGRAEAVGARGGGGTRSRDGRMSVLARETSAPVQDPAAAAGAAKDMDRLTPANEGSPEWPTGPACQDAPLQPEVFASNRAGCERTLDATRALLQRMLGLLPKPWALTQSFAR